MEQGPDALCAHFCFRLQLVQRHFQMSNFCDVALGACLILCFYVLLEFPLPRMEVFELCHFVVQDLFGLLR